MYERLSEGPRFSIIKFSFYGWKEELISSINNENVNINTGKIISHFPHNVHNSYILWVWVMVFNGVIMVPYERSSATFDKFCVDTTVRCPVGLDVLVVL